jgi:glycosyltransferase involved in cell wall biosynthesis
MSNFSYVLITAARNEEKFIEKTVHSVIKQSLLPRKWIIVSDASTDKTEDIVRNYCSEYNFIELICTSGDKTRNFGSKARAVMFAYNTIKNLEFDFVGNLDADISFQSYYFERILSNFNKEDKLGVAGGVRFDFCGGKFKSVYCPPNSVGGPFQLFKRQCFEQVGGYIPSKYGGIDAAAEIKARALGWKVRSFKGLHLYHHRCTGTGSGNSIRYRIHTGLKFYSLGYHPLFITLKFFKEFTRKPPIIGSLISIAAFFWALLFRYEKQFSMDVVKFLRNEQKGRMFSLFGFKGN